MFTRMGGLTRVVIGGIKLNHGGSGSLVSRILSGHK